jgi:hypothetical protein
LLLVIDLTNKPVSPKTSRAAYLEPLRLAYIVESCVISNVRKPHKAKNAKPSKTSSGF